jgi:hypothetical protein
MGVRKAEEKRVLNNRQENPLDRRILMLEKDIKI